jgi:hypothetical protein
MRAILCAILALPCTGCLVHSARVDGTGADQTAGRSATGRTVSDGAPSLACSGPLPYEIPAVWMLRDAEGRLNIGRATALSPLPWWQRFPVDFAVDLWPGDVTVATVATVTPQPLIARTADEITAEARTHGYAE